MLLVSRRRLPRRPDKKEKVRAGLHVESDMHGLSGRARPVIRVVVACALLAAVPAGGQGPSTSGLRRTAWGDPDLQGYWTTGGFAFTLEKGGMYAENLSLSAGNAC